MAGTIQKKSELVKELNLQEQLLIQVRQDARRQTVKWVIIIALVAVIAFTAGGVVATW